MPAQIIQRPNSRYARGFDAIDAVGALMLALAVAAYRGRRIFLKPQDF